MESRCWVESRAVEPCSAMDKHAVQLVMLQLAGNTRAAHRMETTQVYEVVQ